MITTIIKARDNTCCDISTMTTKHLQVYAAMAESLGGAWKEIHQVWSLNLLSPKLKIDENWCFKPVWPNINEVTIFNFILWILGGSKAETTSLQLPKLSHSSPGIYLDIVDIQDVEVIAVFFLFFS